LEKLRSRKKSSRNPAIFRNFPQLPATSCELLEPSIDQFQIVKEQEIRERIPWSAPRQAHGRDDDGMKLRLCQKL
jgi:hypothetical protein